MDERRVLIFPPGRRDGEVTRGLLKRSGVASCICYDASTLAQEIDLGAAAIVLTDASLMAAGFDRVQNILENQPPWSDLPIVLLCQTATRSPRWPRA